MSPVAAAPPRSPRAPEADPLAYGCGRDGGRPMPAGTSTLEQLRAAPVVRQARGVVRPRGIADPNRRWSGDRREELQAVAVDVLGVEAAQARYLPLVCPPHRIAGGLQACRQCIQVGPQQPGVRLAGGPEVLLYAEVQLDAVAGEPAAAPPGQGGWLRLLGQAEDADVEGPRRVLGSGRAGELYVVDHGPQPSAAVTV